MHRDLVLILSPEMGRNLHILLVENHDDIVQFLSQYLQAGGHTVTVALSAAEALEKVRMSRPDLLLCDIGLPDDDGWNLLGRMGADRPPVCIAMSGYGMTSDIRRSQEAGFHHHLIKPFLPGDLDALLLRV